MKKLGEKKITEQSQESSNSATKLAKKHLNIRIPNEKKEFSAATLNRE
jgi:hypothetical protein